MKNRWIQVMFFLVSVMTIAIAQNTISISLEKDSILIGDQFDINVKLNAIDIDDIKSIDFSQWANLDNQMYHIDTNYFEKVAELTIIGENKWGVSRNQLVIEADKMQGWFDQSNSVEFPIKASIYDDGVFIFQSPVINTKSGKRYPAAQGAALQVLGMDLGEARDSIELMPIKPIIEEEVTWEDYKVYIFILFFLLLAPLLIKMLFNKKSKKEVEVIEKEIYIPAHIKALDALKSLKGRQLWQSGNIKAYQSELTDIIRLYLEDRFDINALEMTTDEINRALLDKDFDKKHSTTLQRILQMADLVKFAKAKPSDDIHDQFMSEAEGFVQATRRSDEEIDRIINPIKQVNTNLED